MEYWLDPTYMHDCLMSQRIGNNLLFPPSMEVLIAFDPILIGHPKHWSWQEFWVIGIAVVRYRRQGTNIVMDSTGNPVIELLGARRPDNAVDLRNSTEVLRRGVCENHHPGCWNIPTAYVEPEHKDSLDTLVRTLAKDFGMRARGIVGACSNLTWEAPLPGTEYVRPMRQVTYVVLPDGDEKDWDVPEASEYSQVGWMTPERLSADPNFPMTDAVRLAVDIFRFAALYQLSW